MTPKTALIKPDAACLEAVELALRALDQSAVEGGVGNFVRAEMLGERFAAHYFTCTLPGYRGWEWQVTLARAPRAKNVTVCETTLLPTGDALMAPEWVPWDERLRPDDVTPGVELPFIADDERLEPGYAGSLPSDEDAQALSSELFLGRARVLSPYGREMAAQRWAEGEFGPDAELAKGAAGKCMDCGFLALAAGSFRQSFGFCTNEWSPADGRIVHLGFGCGAHSQTAEETDAVEANSVVVDDIATDMEFIALEPAEPSEDASEDSDVKAAE